MWASLEVMERDARRMRGEHTFAFINLKTRRGLAPVIDFMVERRMLPHRSAKSSLPH